jgi:holo-[acyl-carrier protein] synthase
MIIGIGTDIQAIARVKEAIERSGEAFLKKVFSGEETAYCRTKRHWAQHFAVRFCAKEAFLKALGTGWSQGIRWIEVVVSKNGAGCPQIRLSGRAGGLAGSG